MDPRVWIAGMESLPDLPEDLLGVYDIDGVRWNRNLRHRPDPDHFTPDSITPDPCVPRLLSWTQLVMSRGPVAECSPKEYLHG